MSKLPRMDNSANTTLREYARLMRIDRPVGTLLLLWPTLAALWMAAQGTPPVYLIIIFSLGTFLMRAAGCVINDYADRHVDPHVARTSDRPLAIGTIKPQHALLLFAGLAQSLGPPLEVVEVVRHVDRDRVPDHADDLGPDLEFLDTS